MRAIYSTLFSYMKLLLSYIHSLSLSAKDVYVLSRMCTIMDRILASQRASEARVALEIIEMVVVTDWAARRVTVLQIFLI